MRPQWAEGELKLTTNYAPVNKRREKERGGSEGRGRGGGVGRREGSRNMVER